MVMPAAGPSSAIFTDLHSRWHAIHRHKHVGAMPSNGHSPPRSNPPAHPWSPVAQRRHKEHGSKSVRDLALILSLARSAVCTAQTGI